MINECLLKYIYLLNTRNFHQNVQQCDHFFRSIARNLQNNHQNASIRHKQLSFEESQTQAKTLFT